MALNPKKLTTTAFQTGIDTLMAGFRVQDLPEKTIEVYYARINFVTDEEFSRAVNNILDKEQWFPTIKVLLDWLPEPKKYEQTLEEILS